MILWLLDAHDESERRWSGYLWPVNLDKHPEYWVLRNGCGCTSDDDFGDACENEADGINCCEAHHKYGKDWVRKIHADPILSQDDV